MIVDIEHRGIQFRSFTLVLLSILRKTEGLLFRLS